MKDFYVKLGKRLKDLRERQGMSQDILAKKLNLPRPAVSQIERGERTITADELIKLSEVFHLPVETLLSLKEQPEVILPARPRAGWPAKQKAGVSEVKEKTQPYTAQATKPQLRINVPQKNLEKFKEVLLYILDKVGSKPNIGETVVYKLLYFIDFDYYEKYEEQFIGAQYQKNKYGPTPVEFAKIAERMIADGEIEKVKSKYFDFPQTKYLPLRKPDLSKLNAAELDTIEDVLNHLSDMNAAQISEYSHNDVPWRTTKEGEMIEYEAVFYRTTPYSVREYPKDVS